MVLLSGILVQLGSKKITFKQGDPKQIPTQDCHLVAITLHKSDWSQEEWQKALYQTSNFIKEILRNDRLDQHVHAMWGRSLRHGKTPSNPAQAQTVQMHCTIDHAHLSIVLKHSGFNYLFMTPKDSGGRIDPEFRVIWTDADMVKVIALSTQTAQCLGAIRGKNGALGLRFPKAAYEKAWEVICPGKPVPSATEGEIWKLQGLPFGCTQQMVEAWCEAQQWDCRPFRSLGPQTWLLKTTQEPPKGLLMFNSSPVLLTYVPPKQNTSTANLLLGPRSKPMGHGMAAHDPWTTGADPWAGSKWAKPQAAMPPRSLEGPAEARFKQQDEQIEKMKADIEQLSAKQDKHAHEVANHFQQVEAREKSLAANMQDSLQKMQQGWNQTLSSTMQQHSKTMDQQFQELKTLFLASSKRKSPEEGDQDMR